MKKALGLILILISFHNAFACDDILIKFERDCRIQNDFRKIKSEFLNKNISIDQIAEYRALRFIARNAWNQGSLKNTPVSEIYPPAPQAWDLWSSGVDQVLNSGEYSIDNLSIEKIQEIHNQLYNKSVMPSSEFKNFTHIRSRNSKNTSGYCNPLKEEFDSSGKELSISERVENQKRIFNKLDTELKNIMFQYVISNESTPVTLKDFKKMSSLMGIEFVPSQNQECKSSFKTKEIKTFTWVSYSEPRDLQNNLNIWISFVKRVKSLYSSQQMGISPIAFAAIAQKWIVSLHPFVDGNGRLSRVLQDMILKEFNLPFAPAGDLQNDAT